MVHLYTDSETLNLINEIREKDSDFNLAGFVKTALINKEGIGSLMSETEILKSLNEAKTNLKNAQNKVEHWERVHQDFKVSEELRKKEREAEEEEEKKKEEKEEQKKKYIKETFKEEMGREINDFELEEYFKFGKNIWAFCDDLKERNERNEKSKSE